MQAGHRVYTSGMHTRRSASAIPRFTDGGKHRLRLHARRSGCPGRIVAGSGNEFGPGGGL